MKSLTAKTLMSLAIFCIAALLLTAALVVGGRAIALAHGAQDDLLIVALALGGAAASMVNGFGRTTKRVDKAKQSAALDSSNAGHAALAVTANSSAFYPGA